jgi:hypothetical protein
LIGIFDFNQAALGWRDMFRRVALGTGQTCVFALQNVACQLVIKALDVPLDEREILSVVI